jgi:hypothetical protein
MSQAIDEAREALRLAIQLAIVASDWNLDEVEIDGEMRSTSELQVLFAAALAKLETQP